METADRYAVRFGGHDSNGNDLIPHSIQLQFTHTPGVGVPCVIDPVPYLKSTVWSDDGNGTLTVMVTPSGGTTLKQTSGGTGLLQFKFYIAGGIAGPGLSQPVIKAYDVNGNPMLGITATVTPQ